MTHTHHRRSRRRRAYQLAVLVVAMTATACGGDELLVTPSTVDGDRLLFERGETALAEGNWVEARDYFLQVRDNYPQSSLRADARLGIADTYEGEGGAQQYVSALAEYEDFLSLYPTHPRAAYAQFKLAMVHHHQMRAPERDQSWTESAIREFEAFVERYPNSELIGQARQHLREARDRLSESELIVGRFYHRNKWWPGAIDRLRPILESDPQFTGRESLYFYLADALYNSGEFDEARPLFERLLEEFPATEFRDDVAEAMADIEARAAADIDRSLADNANGNGAAGTSGASNDDSDSDADADAEAEDRQDSDTSPAPISG